MVRNRPRDPTEFQVAMALLSAAGGVGGLATISHFAYDYLRSKKEWAQSARDVVFRVHRALIDLTADVENFRSHLAEHDLLRDDLALVSNNSPTARSLKTLDALLARALRDGRTLADACSNLASLLPENQAAQVRSVVISLDEVARGARSATTYEEFLAETEQLVQRSHGILQRVAAQLQIALPEIRLL